jgi:hypothetical protein
MSAGLRKLIADPQTVFGGLHTAVAGLQRAFVGLQTTIAGLQTTVVDPHSAVADPQFDCRWAGRSQRKWLWDDMVDTASGRGWPVTGLDGPRRTGVPDIGTPAFVPARHAPLSRQVPVPLLVLVLVPEKSMPVTCCPSPTTTVCVVAEKLSTCTS